MFTLEESLADLSINDLYRVLCSSKEAIVLQMHVFNTGHKSTLTLTNSPDKYNYYLEDGYSRIIPNDSEVHYAVKDMLIIKVNGIAKAWTMFCYDCEDFDTFLAKYGITQYKYRQLLKVQD